MQRDDVVARLLRGLGGGDDLTLANVLHPRARMLLDTGDRDGGEIRGRAGVIRGLRALAARHPDAAPEAVRVNGGTGLALRRGDGVVVAVVCQDLDAAGFVTTLWVTAAPSKLGHWNRPHDSDDPRDFGDAVTEPHSARSKLVNGAERGQYRTENAKDSS